MKAHLSERNAAQPRAEVCMGTDWFAVPKSHRVHGHLVHPAWVRLIGIGSSLMAGVLRFRPAARRRLGTGSRLRRH